MSIVLGNESINHQPIGSNKNMINESDIDVQMDSGYASYNQTVASISYSMKRSLEPIAENYESTFNEASIIETPTTRNIRQLTDFHIQTPPNQKQLQETTPTKANHFLRSSHVKGSTKKIRNAWSPYKRTPDKENSSDAIYSIINPWLKPVDTVDIDSENIENNFEMSVNEPSIEYSPIDHHNKGLVSTVTIAPGINKRTLQRHPSGIESSTPISRSTRRTLTQSAVKAQFDTENATNARFLLRKTQSFPAHRASPAKHTNALKEISTNSPAKFDRYDIQPEQDAVPAIAECNPARKMLEFSTNQFNSLLSGAIEVPSSTVAESGVRAPTTPPKKKTLRSTFQRQRRIDLWSPPTVVSPARNDVIKQTNQGEVLRCPKKKPENSISHSLASSKDSGIDKSNDTISVDRMPSDSLSRKAMKRTASNLDDSEPTSSDAVSEPAAKRKLFTGVEQMDILTFLKGKEGALSLDILSSLSDQDLYAASRVSSSWLQIIDSHEEVRLRLERYIRALESAKENANRTIVDQNAAGPSNADNFKRKPFDQRNNYYSLRSTVQKSPPSSPKTRRFRENQKVSVLNAQTFVQAIASHFHSQLFISIFIVNQVVQKLKIGQRIRKCPRCNGDSIVHAASEPQPSSPSPQKLRPNLLFSRRKGYSLPTPSSSKALVASMKAWKSCDDHKKSKRVHSEYAECTRLACAYSFCTNCNCDRHIDALCPRPLISSSPPSDEESISLTKCSQSKKIRRRRLLLDP